MTVLLILCMLIVFLVADHFVQRSRLGRAPAFEAPERDPLTLPAETQLVKNHLWVRREHDGSYRIGLDALISRIGGIMERVILPAPGSALLEGDTGITLGSGERALAIASPLPGRVLEVNRDVLTTPALAHHDPYGAGWLIRIQPPQGLSGVSSRLTVSSPLEWLHRQTDLVREFFLGQLRLAAGVTLPDGGVPVEGVLQRCDGEVWKKFGRNFTELPEAVATKSGTERAS